MRIRVAFMGRSYLFSRQLPDALELSDSAELDDALERLSPRDSDAPSLPASCLVVVSGKHLGTLAAHENCPLADGDELILL